MDLEEVSVERCIVELMSYQLILTSNGIGNSLYKLQYDDNHNLYVLLPISQMFSTVTQYVR